MAAVRSTWVCFFCTSLAPSRLCSHLSETSGNLRENSGACGVRHCSWLPEWESPDSCVEDNRFLSFGLDVDPNVNRIYGTVA